MLISEGRERVDRRLTNEQALESNRAAHSCTGQFLQAVSAEVDVLQEKIAHSERLVWRDFSAVWFRIVLRVVFRYFARDDNDLLVMMADLGQAAN